MSGISVHVGINEVDPAHYQGWSGLLLACEADAQDMQALAAPEGFETTALLTSAATRGAVLGAIDASAERCAPGDIFLLTYSGHGGQVPDTGNDEEADLQDETWCLHDGQLIDDELWMRWERFASGVRILVISDSCHSGTVTKTAYDPLVRAGVIDAPVSNAPDGRTSPTFRVMPDDVAFRTYRANREFYKAIAADLTAPGDVGASVRLISGCQDNQLSLDGAFNGLFTGMLLRVWADGRFQGDYGSFHSQILGRMPPTQSPNHVVVGQHDPAYDRERPFSIARN